jgi:hypothetical protein
MRNYVGNVLSFAVAEVSVEGIRRRPLPEIASLVRESFRSTATDEHFQELVDWMEERKHKGAAAKYVETATVGLGTGQPGAERHVAGVTPSRHRLRFRPCRRDDVGG